MSQPELTKLTAMLREFSWGDTLEEMRSQFNNSFSLPPHPSAQIEAITVDGVVAELITIPEGRGDGATSLPKEDRVILYLHGGGFVMGSCRTHRRIAADLAEASVASVLCVDYRLAPEHPYPAALEDTLTAYRWLIHTQGFQPEQVAIAGDSAGGNLAIAALLCLRDAGDTLPAAALLISPYVDQTCSSPTINTHATSDLIVTPQLLHRVTAWYAPGQDVRQPLISPLFTDLSGLPPLLIHVGASEMLLDDSLQLARQVGLANGPVELKVWRDMVHCFHLFAPILSEGREAIAQAGAFFIRHWPQPVA